MSYYKRVLVQVGSTDFDDLISVLDQEKFYTILGKAKISELVIQFGKGSYVPLVENKDTFDRSYETILLREGHEINVSVHRFILTSQFLEEGCLTISHCGAGTLLEALRSGATSIAVVNTTLMDNH